MQVRTATARRRSERGAAFFTSIFALLLITLLGLALSSASEVSVAVSLNERDGTAAYYIAEAGLAHAIKLITAVGRSNLATLLTVGDGVANTGDELSTQATSPIPAAGVTCGTGSYTVKVGSHDATNGRVAITSIGVGHNGATATLVATIELSGSSDLPALLVGGNLKINGNPQILGTGGIVHTNSTLDFDGNPCASQYFSSASNIVDPGNGMSGSGCTYNGGNVRASQPAITVPTYTMTDLRPLADYIFGQDGKVYVPGSATAIADANSSGKWTRGNGDIWDWDSGNKTWKLSSATCASGTYYSDGNLAIGSNPGETGTVPQVTLLAAGYIDISGNPYFTPKLTHNGVSLSMIAGTDLKISGNPASGRSNFEGRHYAGHQISLSGNPSINGNLIAANLADTASPGGTNFIQLSSGFMEISGNAKITYNLSSGGGSSSTAAVINWREIRN